ncbi:death-associated inhibitor of apoptosis 1-like [Tetranychus urticae]|uniref:death-associated inhibitor of apoptosis 1-like n=1 Tax=Tetranychus urticae TaxID=32264 RepID=UPI00077B8AEC|nr:death-associated inhibitor of apoptosis 1-like [Tetranychus urticae]
MFHPLFKQFACRMKRLESFESWKRDDICRTELADAGFVYYDVDNKVICYQCGCIVNDWFENADPWLIHAQSSPFCFHLYIKSGQAFIDSAREGREPFIEQPVLFAPNADRYTCKICFENEISTVFCPCNHAIACYECSAELTDENCPWFRRKLCDVIRFRFFD